MKKLIFIAIILFAQSASAQIFISEIKYTGNEWIEISNSGAPTDVSLWKFLEGGTNHKLKSIQGGVTLPTGAYAVIADDAASFLNENSGFTGMLFDSSFSLLDGGETISIKSSDVIVVDTVTYTGIKGSKKSTQKVGNSWLESEPTPGVLNTFSSSTNSASPVVTPSQNTSSPDTVSSLDVRAVLGTRVVLAGQPVVFEAKISSLENTSGAQPRTMWYFGDGASREGERVIHTYYYPGEYTAIIDVAIGDLVATDRMLVRVLLPNLSIQTGGDADRTFVAIKNNSSEELDVSGWKIASTEKSFTLPKNTIIGARKNVTFASEVTGLTTPTGPPVFLTFPNDMPVATGGDRPPQETFPHPEVEKNVTPVVRYERPIQSVPRESIVLAKEANAQQASVSNVVPQTVVPQENSQTESDLWPWYIGAAFLAALALLGVRLANGKEDKTTFTADDFKIIENKDDNEPH